MVEILLAIGGAVVFASIWVGSRLRSQVTALTTSIFTRSMVRMGGRDLGLDPPLSVSLDAAVREALGIAVRLGALGINAPPLRQGRHDTVKVMISRALNAESLVAALVAESQIPSIEAINTSAIMYVDLSGRSFSIQRLNPPEGEQLVSDTATWEFDVLPLSAGKQTLTVSASLRVPVPGHGERTVSVPSLEREFTVEVDRLYAGRAFMRQNWQWIGTSAIAAAAIVAGIIWR